MSNKPRKNKLPTKTPQQGGVQKKTVQLQQQITTGPLPPPEVLEGYDQIIPGAAERIVAMAEKEQAHSHQMEKDCIRFTVEEEKRGQRYGLAIAIIAITASLVVSFLGDPVTASVIGGTTVVGLTAAFVVGRKTLK